MIQRPNLPYSQYELHKLTLTVQLLDLTVQLTGANDLCMFQDQIQEF